MHHQNYIGNEENSIKKRSLNSSGRRSLVDLWLRNGHGGVQDTRLLRGFHQSVMEEEDTHNHEAFAYRVKLLKSNARYAITLFMKVCIHNVTCGRCLKEFGKV